MRHFPYQDAWDLDDEAEQYERHLRRKRARSRWAVALLTGVGILTVSSGMILLGTGSRLAQRLDRWEAEVWDPAVAQTREEKGLGRATATATATPTAPPPAPAEPAPVAVPEANAPPVVATPSTPEPSAATAPPSEPSAAPASPPEPTASASARTAERPAAAKTARPTPPRAPSQGRPAEKRRAEPDRDLVYGGGVSWPKGSPSAAPSEKPVERPAPSERSPAPPPSGEDKGAYEDR